VKALVAFSLALSLKPQAVFLAPLLLVLVLQRQFSPLLLYLVPGVYLLLAIPVWLAGRPLAEILLLYANQRILPFPSLTLGATNLYQWLTDEQFDLFFRAGLVVAAVAAATFVFVLYRRHPAGLSDQAMIQAALVIAAKDLLHQPGPGGDCDGKRIPDAERLGQGTGRILLNPKGAVQPKRT
jgi:hypothetical protein